MATIKRRNWDSLCFSPMHSQREVGRKLRIILGKLVKKPKSFAVLCVQSIEEEGFGPKSMIVSGTRLSQTG